MVRTVTYLNVSNVNYSCVDCKSSIDITHSNVFGFYWDEFVRVECDFELIHEFIWCVLEGNFSHVKVDSHKGWKYWSLIIQGIFISTFYSPHDTYQLKPPAPKDLAHKIQNHSILLTCLDRLCTKYTLRTRSAKYYAIRI